MMNRIQMCKYMMMLYFRLMFIHMLSCCKYCRRQRRWVYYETLGYILIIDQVNNEYEVWCHIDVMKEYEWIMEGIVSICCWSDVPRLWKCYGDNMGLFGALSNFINRVGLELWIIEWRIQIVQSGSIYATRFSCLYLLQWDSVSTFK